MKKGIDISEWQGKLSYNNFKAIKDSGVEFIIIRCGYTSYGKQKKKYKDKYFENNYNLAKQLSIPIGTYYYSCATNETEAIEEANFILSLIRNKTFEYPICIDTEDKHDIYNVKNAPTSQYSIGKDKLTNVIKTICKNVEANNNYVSIYASTSWFKNNLILDEIKDIDKWIAQWSKTVTFPYKYGMWQYTSSGKVAGINGNVDLNYSYIDYVSIITNGGFNGYIKIEDENKPKVEPKEDENKPNIEPNEDENKSNVEPKEETKKSKFEKIKKVLKYIFDFISKLLSFLIKIIK